MQKRNLFLLILTFNWLQINLVAQLPLYSDSFDRRKRVIDRCEILNAADTKLITDSITHVAVRHKINMYRQLYNIDSIFHDIPSLKAFLQNPYILEYPWLKGYEYWPEYEVNNMLDMSLGSDENTTFCQRGFFEIRKFDQFIRKADNRKGIKADTIGPKTPECYGDCNMPTSICGWSDHHYAVYFNSFTRELEILGGCLPVEQIKETDSDARISEGYSIQYALTRLIQKTYKMSRRTFLYNPPAAFGNNVKFTQSNLGSINFDKNKKYLFYGLTQSYIDPFFVMRDRKPLEYWLIIVPMPAQIIGHFPPTHSMQTDIIWEPAEPWDNIEMIRFIPATRKVQDRYSIDPIGKFPYYEERITIKNNPGPKDCLVHFRGVTQEEMEELKKIEGMDELLYECKRKQF